MTIKKEDVDAMLGFLLPESGAVDPSALEAVSLLTSSKMRFALRTRTMQRLFKGIYDNLSELYKSGNWEWLVELSDIRNCKCALRHNSWPKGLIVAFENYREELTFGVISPSISLKGKYKGDAEILPDITRKKINDFMNGNPEKIAYNWKISAHWIAWANYNHHIARSDGIQIDDLINWDFLVNARHHSERIANYLNATAKDTYIYFNNPDAL